jgi:hypothetical protein
MSTPLCVQPDASVVPCAFCAADVHTCELPEGDPRVGGWHLVGEIPVPTPERMTDRIIVRTPRWGEVLLRPETWATWARVAGGHEPPHLTPGDSWRWANYAGCEVSTFPDYTCKLHPEGVCTNGDDYLDWPPGMHWYCNAGCNAAHVAEWRLEQAHAVLTRAGIPAVELEPHALCSVCGTAKGAHAPESHACASFTPYPGEGVPIALADRIEAALAVPEHALVKRTLDHAAEGLVDAGGDQIRVLVEGGTRWLHPNDTAAWLRARAQFDPMLPDEDPTTAAPAEHTDRCSCGTKLYVAAEHTYKGGLLLRCSACGTYWPGRGTPEAFWREEGAEITITTAAEREAVEERDRLREEIKAHRTLTGEIALALGGAEDGALEDAMARAVARAVRNLRHTRARLPIPDQYTVDAILRVCQAAAKAHLRARKD